jgi:hypothetical protein
MLIYEIRQKQNIVKIIGAGALGGHNTVLKSITLV